MNYYQPQYVNNGYNGVYPQQYQNYTPYNALSNNYNVQNQNNAQIQPNINQMQQQIQTINGKVVDGIDVVRSFDVPIGETYFFPQANGEIVYSKGWMNDGNTFVSKYVLQEEEHNKNEDSKSKKTDEWSETLTEIYCQIDSLNKKLDNLSSNNSQKTSSSTSSKRTGGDK